LWAVRTTHSLGVVIWIIFSSKLASLLLNRLATIFHKYAFFERRAVTLASGVFILADAPYEVVN